MSRESLWEEHRPELQQLVDAGWSVRRIGEACGVSGQRVSVVLNDLRIWNRQAKLPLRRRREKVSMLNRRGLTSAQISKALGLTPSTVSRDLAWLKLRPVSRHERRDQKICQLYMAKVPLAGIAQLTGAKERTVKRVLRGMKQEV